MNVLKEKVALITDAAEELNEKRSFASLKKAQIWQFRKNPVQA